MLAGAAALLVVVAAVAFLPGRLAHLDPDATRGRRVRESHRGLDVGSDR